MKREIIFKALRLDGKGWVEGFINVILGEYYILECDFEIHEEFNESEVWTIMTEVNPETVCQFIDAEDREGVKIFEGDYDQDFQVVHFCDRSLSYQLATYDIPTKDFIHCNCYSCEGNFNLSEHSMILVTGNIHTNK